jgi:hypothetical protein
VLNLVLNCTHDLQGQFALVNPIFEQNQHLKVSIMRQNDHPTPPPEMGTAVLLINESRFVSNGGKADGKQGQGATVNAWETSNLLPKSNGGGADGVATVGAQEH